jgi:hypothetical protein
MDAARVFRSRLTRKCNELLGEHGESEVYDHFLSHGRAQSNLVELVCNTECSEPQGKAKGRRKKKGANKETARKNRKDLASEEGSVITPGAAKQDKRRQQGSSNNDSPLANTGASESRATQLRRLRSALQRVQREVASLHAEELQLLDEIERVVLDE